MTTSASAGVALLEESVPTPPKDLASLIEEDREPNLYIVGFAPSWSDTPWDQPESDYWGMNALHKVAGDKKWTGWFQLHDIDESHPHDKEEHLAWLAEQDFPIYMWDEQMMKYPLPNAVPYPRDEIVAKYGRYFTNTVSWMIALAIEFKYKKLGVYGIDMAQDTEYRAQRPSCEYFLGVAAGRGMIVEIPGTSDLLKSPWLYGFESGGPMLTKYRARLKELQERRAEMERQRNAAHEAVLQISGAIEDTQYWSRVWTQLETKQENQDG